MAILLISNIASAAKIVVLGPFVYDAGTLVFPISYIFGDILTEVYGYALARRAIWTGFFAAALMAATITLVGILPGEPEWAARVGQEAYNNIFGLTPRIVAASLAAYLAGSFTNAYIMARLKVITGGRRLWLRTISSTVVGEGIDTVLFVLLAFAYAEGFAGALLWSIILSNYIFKVGVEVIFTPLTYAITGFVKRAERSDVFDTQTNFSPFRLHTQE